MFDARKSLTKVAPEDRDFEFDPTPTPLITDYRRHVTLFPDVDLDQGADYLSATSRGNLFDLICVLSADAGSWPT